jgi:hypothetical protein
MSPFLEKITKEVQMFLRGLSSVGRALALQAWGHRFEPDRLHHIMVECNLLCFGILWWKWEVLNVDGFKFI